MKHTSACFSTSLLYVKSTGFLSTYLFTNSINSMGCTHYVIIHLSMHTACTSVRNNIYLKIEVVKEYLTNIFCYDHFLSIYPSMYICNKNFPPIESLSLKWDEVEGHVIILIILIIVNTDMANKPGPSHSHRREVDNLDFVDQVEDVHIDVNDEHPTPVQGDTRTWRVCSIHLCKRTI